MATDSQVTANSDGESTKGTPCELTPSVPSPNGPPRGIGNANAMGSGLKSDPALAGVRLLLGSLPKSMARVERQTAAFRRLLESTVIEVHGSIDLVAAALIQTACRWERHSLLALRWLREHELPEAKRLNPDQRLAYSTAIATASEKRDKAIERLKLTREAGNVLDAAFAKARDA